MRISDWSSDVCSSDLQARPARRLVRWVRPRISHPYTVVKNAPSTSYAIRFAVACPMLRARRLRHALSFYPIVRRHEKLVELPAFLRLLLVPVEPGMSARP